MTEKEVLIYSLTKLLGKTDAEITSMLFEGEGDDVKLIEDAGAKIIESVTTKMQKLKGNETETWDKAWKKAQKDTMEKAEKILAEKAGIDIEGETLEDKVSNFVNITVEKSKTGKITDDTIKAHPLYLDVESKFQKLKTIADEKARIETEFNEFKNNTVKSERVSKVRQFVKSQIEALNLNLSTDATKKAKQIDLLVTQIINEADDFEEADSKFYPVKQGKRIEDAQFNPKTADILAREIALQYFEPLKQDPKGGAGNKNEGGTFTAGTKIQASEYDLKLKELDKKYNNRELSPDEYNKQVVELGKAVQE